MIELQWWECVIAAVIALLGSARVTRLIVHDTFPPIVRVRIWYEDHVPDEWATLVHCHWCMGPWVTLACMAWFAGGLFWLPGLIAWTLFWGWMALSYLVSQYVHFDQGSDSE